MSALKRFQLPRQRRDRKVEHTCFSARVRAGAFTRSLSSYPPPLIVLGIDMAVRDKGVHNLCPGRRAANLTDISCATDGA